MHKTFCSLSILALFALSACIIEDTSDDDAASASNSASNSNSNGDSGTQGGNETSAAGESTAATSEATTAPADSSGGSGTGGGACGWGPLEGQMNVMNGYSCSGSGEDPRNVFPIDCPAEVTLEDNGPCGGDMGVTGVGCCDGNTNWYCADTGSGPVLFSDPC